MFIMGSILAVTLDSSSQQMTTEVVANGPLVGESGRFCINCSVYQLDICHSMKEANMEVHRHKHFELTCISMSFFSVYAG